MRKTSSQAITPVIGISNSEVAPRPLAPGSNRTFSRLRRGERLAWPASNSRGESQHSIAPGERLRVRLARVSG